MPLTNGNRETRLQLNDELRKATEALEALEALGRAARADAVRASLAEVAQQLRELANDPAQRARQAELRRKKVELEAELSMLS